MMPTSDSALIFGDGTFTEQVQDLVNYIGREVPEDARVAFVKPFQDALAAGSSDASKRKTIILVLSAVKGLGPGTEREIEGFFNLLYAHILASFPEPEPLKEQIAPLVHVISNASGNVSVKYRILSNLFNILPRKSPLRLQVYQALLTLATKQDEIDLLNINLKDVQSWTQEWDVPEEDKSGLLKEISTALEQSGQPERSYEFILAYVASLPVSSPAAAPATLEAIGTAIRTTSIVDFHALLRLDAIHLVKSHPLFALLNDFVNGDVQNVESWLSHNQSHLAEYKLEQAQLERKIRLLTLASLATHNVGKDIPYSKITSTLHIPSEQVETWAIDAMRANLIGGKLSQPTQTLHITRATHRSFHSHDWHDLEKRLIAWKSELQGVIETLSTSRQSKANKARTVQNAEVEKGQSVKASA